MPTLRSPFGAAAAFFIAALIGVAMLLSLRLATAGDGDGVRLTLELVKLAIGAAALIGVYELDARINAWSPRLMRIGTETGVIAAALFFAAGALGYQFLMAPSPDFDAGNLVAVTWIVDRLGAASVPGFGLWALLAGWTGLRRGALPQWTAWAGVAFGAASVLSFLAPQAMGVAAFAALVWWAGVGFELTGRRSPRAVVPAIAAAGLTP